MQSVYLYFFYVSHCHQIQQLWMMGSSLRAQWGFRQISELSILKRTATGHSVFITAQIVPWAKSCPNPLWEECWTPKLGLHVPNIRSVQGILFSFILFTLLFLLLMVKKCPSGKNMFLKNTLRFNLYFFFCYQKVSTNKSFPQATTNCLIKHIHPVKHGPILSCWFTLSCVLFCRVPLIRYGLLVE